ncbi:MULTISPECIES: DUF5681 domain-containing protein [Sphingobium]|uniref:DUF5681 domain-containing protein n=1 Tax=Sphingobium TaxID=165695 RepID=UPI0015ECC2C7|nr:MULTISPECIES: DUF5681 domain-containing protein [Sphingobium]MCW2363122.1 hypothetical protein [Sphingobium sp. B10D3B]MCW2400198.1 hypothetical protein [Sphingobium sp. B10D7B]MCW2407176.1 hypothetical protein [Sphingobium xanthum]
MSDEYEVGYKKPPTETRFKKGQSGNPAGRKPKPQRQMKANIAEVVAEVWSKPVEINGTVFSTIEVVLRTLMMKAMKGDLAALKQVIYLSKLYPVQRRYKGGAALHIARTPDYLREINAFVTQAQFRGGTEKESYTLGDVPLDMLQRAIAIYVENNPVDPASEMPAT